MIKIKPLQGHFFNFNEKEIFLGFYTTRNLPDFAFSFNFGPTASTNLKQRLLSQFDKQVEYIAEDMKKHYFQDPFFEKDGSIRNFANLNEFREAKESKLNSVLNNGINE